VKNLHKTHPPFNGVATKLQWVEAFLQRQADNARQKVSLDGNKGKI
jgi:hypothetical protein